jgi:hypothetical protein
MLQTLADKPFLELTPGDLRLGAFALRRHAAFAPGCTFAFRVARRSGWCRFTPTQQVTGGAVIRAGIADGIGNDQSTRDRRQKFSRIARREPFRSAFGDLSAMNDRFVADLEREIGALLVRTEVESAT